jgi:DNA-binding response OmpR family regulator
MHLSLNLYPGKRKFLAALTLFMFVSVICLAFNLGGSDGFNSSRRHVLLRQIGHEILLQSGDSTSRVLPVKRIGENEYQLSFENELTFQPDFLVTTIQRLLAKDLGARDYIVNVLNCNDASVAYGYAISSNRKDDIIACLGRKQPKACYLISITFQPTKTNTAKNGYLLGSLALLALIGYIFLSPRKSRKVLPGNQATEPEDQPTEPQNQLTNMFTLGLVLFDAQNRKLIVNEKAIDLTATESRILRIFALSPNEMIERSRLQKEIWEDEGVIVGRSLDMFISKLRKKLEVDPNLKISVIRGKGYKLEISS